MSSVDIPLRVAVLLNGPSTSPFAADVATSFREILSRIIRHSEVTFYDPIVKQEYPDISKYDLVILSGGTTDPMSQEPWVLKMMEFIRQTEVAQRENPKITAKLLGICWGHQAICIAFGGVVETMKRKPDLGPKCIHLTEKGSNFFKFASSNGSYTAMEFHRRAITKTTPGFMPLAEDNEVFLSTSNMILSTQAHPEMGGILARRMLKAANAYAQDRETSELDNIETAMMDPTDGDAVFANVIKWVAEK